MQHTNSDRKTGSGFTLIELIIVLVIIGILTTVALPSYQQYMLQSRRAEGMAALTELMYLQEQYYVEQTVPSYTISLTELGYSEDSGVPTENGYYLIAAAACPTATISSCVELTATAQNAQQADGALTLDSLGNRERNGQPGWD